MAENVQSLLLRVDATTELLRRELAKAAAETDQWADKTQKSADKASGAIDGASKSYAGLGNSMELLKGLAAGFSATQILQYLFDTSAAFQTLQVRLEVATGSLDNAGIAFDELKKLAAETPFSLQEVVDAFINLKNLGLDPSRAAIISYGNTASALGKTLDEVVQAVADAASGEFERLKEFGIKASTEGNNVAFTFKGVTTTVEKNATAIEGYLRKIGETDFAGGMEKQSKTLAGALSNLGDSADQLAVAVAGIGFNDAFLISLTGVSGALNNMREQIVGLERIYQDSGIFGLLTNSGNSATLSSSATGRQSLLEQELNKADLALQKAERAKKSGGFFALLGEGSDTNITQLRNNTRDAERRLLAFEAANADALAREAAKGGSDPLAAFRSASSKTAIATAKKKTGKAKKFDPYAKENLTASENRMGFTEKLGDVASLAPSAMSDPALVNLDVMAAKLNTIKTLASTIPPINPIDTTAVELAGKFSDNLSRGLGQAIVYGQSLGDALVSSIKAAAAELISSQLLKLLNGDKGDGGFIGSIIKGAAAVFGGGRAGGGPVDAGTPYLVGEHRPEIFVPSTRGKIVPRADGFGGGGMTIAVDARGATDPAIIEAAARRGAQQGIATAAQAFGKSQRQSIPRGRV